MTQSKLKEMRFFKYLNLLTLLSIILMVFANMATAQSTDPFTPTPMTTETVKGRWIKDKLISHYYSFMAGPGVIKVSFNSVADSGSTIVGGDLTDADGHLFTRLESVDHVDIVPIYVQGVAGGDGLRLTSTYEIKRRQRVIVRFYTAITSPDSGGNYTIKVSGDGISFSENNSSANNSSNNINSTNNNAADKISCLPKSGKLRIVMKDGTVQEINLSSVNELTVKP